MAVCDFCGTTFNDVEMTILAGREVASLAERGFIPSHLPAWEELRSEGVPVSKEKAWHIFVEKFATQEWGICPSCLAEIEKYNATTQRPNTGESNMNVADQMCKAIISSPDKFVALGIVGQPYAGKRTLAKQIAEQLNNHGRPTEIYSADEHYYVEIMPGIPMRGGNLGRDIREFKDGTEIFIGEDRIPSGTSVLIFLATYKYLSKDVDGYNALDFRAVITFKKSQIRLQRKIAAEPASAAQAPGEFTQEQMLEMQARDLIHSAHFLVLRGSMSAQPSYLQPTSSNRE